MADALAQVHLQVFGEVQGVFFRTSTLERAQSLSLTGWVKNLPDGSVEIAAEGQRYALEELVAWVRRGPPAAKVRDVIVQWGPHTESYDAFRVVR